MQETKESNLFTLIQVSQVFFLMKKKNRLNIKVNACKSKLKNPRHVCKVGDKIVFKILILDNLFQTEELEISLGTFSYI